MERWRRSVAAATASLRRVLAHGPRGRRAQLAAAAGTLVVLLVLGLGLGARRGGRLMPGGGKLPEVIAFYQNGWSAVYRSSFPSVQQHYSTINTVLAFWYSVDGTGRLHSHQPNPGVTTWIERHRMKMGVLINNIAGSAGSNAAMLTNPTARATAVKNIAQLARSRHYQEVNIDFELLRPSDRQGLLAFMQALRAALPAGVVLSESVFPKLGVPTALNGAYDYTALAKTVDYLVIMLYDKNSDGGPAGPVSPYPWVVDNLNWFLHTAGIAPTKIVLAAGVYGYDWRVGSTSATEMPLTQIQAKIRALGVTPRTDPASENPYFTYTARDGTRHVVWFQNQQTVRQRLDLAGKLGLRGVAIWALGEETPAVWSVIEQTWGPKA